MLFSLFWLTVLSHLKYKMYFLKLIMRNLMMMLNLIEIQILLILNEEEQQQQQQHNEKRVVLILLTLEHIVSVHLTELLYHYSINVPKRIKTYGVNLPEIISVKFLIVIESFIIVMD